MSPILLIVFGPVILGGAALFALLLGAAGAGAWEAVGDHARENVNVSVPTPSLSRVALPKPAHARAA